MARRNIVTLARATPEDARFFEQAQRIIALEKRFAFVESVQAQAAAVASNALDIAQDALDSSLNPRTIISVQIIDGHLIITFSDGTTQDAGLIGIVAPTLDNVTGLSNLMVNSIPGLVDTVNSLGNRLTALGLN